MQIRVFDLDHDDPLMLSSIIGEAVVACWSMEGIFRKQGYGKYSVAYIIYIQSDFLRNRTIHNQIKCMYITL